MEKLTAILSHFDINLTQISNITPLGNGLINDTYLVDGARRYVLQRINHSIFTDVEMLQANIAAVSRHLQRKGQAHTLTLVPLRNSDSTYWHDGTNYWRLMDYIEGSHTLDSVTPELSYEAGVAFGRFQANLVDIPETLGEIIPNFHNVEFRLQQLRDAVAADPCGRVAEVQPLLDEIFAAEHEMTFAERLYRAGQLPKRICHCDTKVNNMLFDDDGNVMCVIDLDTVMPSFVFSDYGDFLRTAANTAAEDEPDTDKIEFRRDIFEAFTRGYLHSYLTDAPSARP